MQLLPTTHDLGLQNTIFVEDYLAGRLILTKGTYHLEKGSLDLIANIVKDVNEGGEWDVEKDIGRKDPIGILERKVDGFEQIHHSQVNFMDLKTTIRKCIFAVLLDAHEEIH